MWLANASVDWPPLFLSYKYLTDPFPSSKCLIVENSMPTTRILIKQTGYKYY